MIRDFIMKVLRKKERVITIKRHGGKERKELPVVFGERFLRCRFDKLNIEKEMAFQLKRDTLARSFLKENA